MTYKEFAEFAAAWESIATIIAFLAAAAWALSLFIRQREGHPHVEFSAEIKFVRKQGAWWIVELIAWVENKGKVQHQITNFAFDVFALHADEPVDVSKAFNGQVYFPHEIAKTSWLPERFGNWTFVDPGVRAHYSYVARVPDSASTLLMHTWFDFRRRWYQRRQQFCVAETTVRVPSDERDILPNERREFNSECNNVAGEGGDLRH